MKEFFFGTGAVVAWSLMSMLFAILAGNTWLVVREVGGIRGTALATVFTCAAVITGGFGVILSHTAIVSNAWVGAVITAAWWPLMLASIVLADIYAADRNSHRSFTTRAYLWYKSLSEEDEGNSTP